MREDPRHASCHGGTISEITGGSPWEEYMLRGCNGAQAWLRYPLVCTVLGLALGWGPMLFHGPIPEKFDVLYLNGAVAVWAFYCARLLIGFLVGITTWPEPWLLRGPLIGVLGMLPVTFVALATPGCGET